MKEYIVHAKIKNNLLLSAILERYENVAQFCKDNGLCPNHIGKLVNLRSKAINESGEWTPSISRLAEVLGKEPEELFSEEQREMQLRSNQAFIEMSREQLLSKGDIFEQMECAVDARRLLMKLPKRQQEIINARFFDGKDLQEVAKDMNISKARVSQLEAKSLRALKKHANIDEFYQGSD
jgi:RNA polymerase sigma factor (sigma-70 family)